MTDWLLSDDDIDRLRNGSYTIHLASPIDLRTESKLVTTHCLMCQLTAFYYAEEAKPFGWNRRNVCADPTCLSSWKAHRVLVRSNL